MIKYPAGMRSVPLLLSGLFFLFAAMAATPVAAQSPASVVGNWRQLVSGQPYQACHYHFSVDGRSIRVSYVTDVDDLVTNRLKGDSTDWGSFALQGRRITGRTQIGSQFVPITGILNENLREIQWRYPLPGVVDMPSGAPSYKIENLVRD
jgi:hypothetical protein